MDTIIKGFLGVFIFAMIMYLAVGTISAEIDSSAARSYMDDAKKEIAEVNMAASVIDAVGKQAVHDGYQMKITVYGSEENTTADYTNESESIGNTSKAESIELVMTYKYKIPILGISNEHVERGYVN